MLQPNAVEFGYEQTLITGHYRQQLGDYAKQAAEQAKIRSAILKKKAADERSAQRYQTSRIYRVALSLKQSAWKLMQNIGEDWLLLIIIGILVAVISFTMDWFAGWAYQSRLYAFDAASFSVPLQYFVWVFYHVGFCVFAAGFNHLVNPQAAGTGFPEVKAIIGGIELKGFLSWRSMITKYVAGTAAMCSGLPLAKGGVIACIACCITHLLCKRFAMFKGIYENESRKIEMLAAAVSVAMATTFSSPVSGVLFCIELTATFFEVQNYWRAFFCTVFGTTLYRVLSMLSQYELTIGAFMKTSLHLINFPFDIVEYLAFTVLGALCGLTGAAFVYTHRSLILFVRGHKKLSAFLQKYRLLYPFLVATFVSTMTFPPWLGQYSAGLLTSRLALAQLLHEKPLSSPPSDATTDLEIAIRSNWIHPGTSVFVTLAAYFVVQFICSAVSHTLAVPFGALSPMLAFGASLGRIVGEAMSLWFPHGVNAGYGLHHIVPGGYAIIGAAATSGAVLQMISMALLVHEYTGQLNYLLPTLWATMISNLVARSLMPSVIDSIIQIKKIPFLPVFKHPSSRAHQVMAKDIMQTKLKFLSQSSTYDDVKNMLIHDPFVRSFPLVDTPETMLLIGSVQRNELIDALEKQIRACVPTNSKPADAPQCGKEVKFTPDALPEHRKTPKAVNYSKGDESAPSTSEDAGEGAAAKKAHRGSWKPILKRKAPLGGSSYEDGEPGGAAESLLLQGDDSLRRSLSCSVSRGSRTNSSVNFSPASPPPEFLAFANDDARWLQNSESKKRKSFPRHKLLKSLTYMEELAYDSAEEDERIRREEERLNEKIDIAGLQIDQAPFQLSEKTSLHKVHSLFVLLRLSQAYVTNFGRLVGIVTIKEVQTELGDPSVHEAPRPMKLFGKTASATIGGGDRGMSIVVSGS